MARRDDVEIKSVAALEAQRNTILQRLNPLLFIETIGVSTHLVLVTGFAQCQGSLVQLGKLIRPTSCRLALISRLLFEEISLCSSP